MKDDITKIIAMVQEDKITAAEAEDLISALKTEDVNDDPPQSKRNTNRKIKVRVQSDDRENVNVNVPLWLVQSFLKMGHGIASSIPEAKKYADELDIDLLMVAINEGQTGNIIDLKSDSGDTVLISIE